MGDQNLINQRIGQREYVTKLTKSVGGILANFDMEHMVRFASLRTTLEGKIGVLAHLDDQILPNKCEKEKICKEIEKGSDIRIKMQDYIPNKLSI